MNVHLLDSKGLWNLLNIYLPVSPQCSFSVNIPVILDKTFVFSIPMYYDKMVTKHLKILHNITKTNIFKGKKESKDKIVYIFSRSVKEKEYYKHFIDEKFIERRKTFRTDKN